MIYVITIIYYFYALATKYLGIGMLVGESVGLSVYFNTTFKKVWTTSCYMLYSTDYVHWSGPWHHTCLHTVMGRALTLHSFAVKRWLAMTYSIGIMVNDSDQKISSIKLSRTKHIPAWAIPRGAPKNSCTFKANAFALKVSAPTKISSGWPIRGQMEVTRNITDSRGKIIWKFLGPSFHLRFLSIRIILGTVPVKNLFLFETFPYTNKTKTSK